MVEDLLRRNEVDVRLMAEEVKSYSGFIKSREDRIEQLLKDRASLLEELEKVKQDEANKGD